MTNEEKIKQTLIENLARIDLFPEMKITENLPSQLVGIAEALEVTNPTRETLIRALQEKNIQRVLDVGISSGTDTPLTDLARLQKEGGGWMFPSNDLVGIDDQNSPSLSQSRGMFTFESSNILNYMNEEPFDIIYAKGVLSSAWDIDISREWSNSGEVPKVFLAMQKLLSTQPNAVIILSSYIADEWILLTEEQAEQCGFEVVEGASELFTDQLTQRMLRIIGRNGKMYSKLVLKRATSKSSK